VALAILVALMHPIEAPHRAAMSRSGRLGDYAALERHRAALERDMLAHFGLPRKEEKPVDDTV